MGIGEVGRAKLQLATFGTRALKRGVLPVVVNGLDAGLARPALLRVQTDSKSVESQRAAIFIKELRYNKQNEIQTHLPRAEGSKLFSLYEERSKAQS